MSGLVVFANAGAFAENAAADDLECVVDHVTDGDTFRCANRTRIRIHGIDAPEIDIRGGVESRDALAAIIAGRSLVCEQNGISYDRIVATCLLDGPDIAALTVQRAAARGCPRYSGGTYAQYEDTRHLSLPIGEFC